MKEKIVLFLGVIITVAAVLFAFYKTGYFDMNIPYSEYYDDIRREGNWYYSVDNENNARIISVRRIAGTLELPETIGGYPVSYADHALITDEQAKRIKKISIPDSVILADAFDLRDTPWYKNQPDGVVYLGNRVLSYKGDVPENGIIEVKDGIEYICEYAFRSIDAKEIILPDTLKIIGYSAFDKCEKLQKIKLPESITEIHGAAFADCTALESIEFPDKYIDLSAWSFYGCKWFEEHTAGPVYAGKILISYLGDIPSETEISIKEGTVAVSDFVFEGWENISYVNIPESCSYISDYAFNSAILDGFRVDKNNKAFSTDEKGSLYNKDKTKLIKYAISDTAKEFVVPGTVTEIAGYAFNKNKSLEKITINKNVEIIGGYAFWQCKNIKEFNVEAENKQYASPDGNLYSKDGKDLICYANGKTEKSFTVPEGVTELYNYAFCQSACLEEIVLHEKIEYIGTIDECPKITDDSFKGRVSEEIALFGINLQGCGNTNECRQAEVRHLVVK